MTSTGSARKNGRSASKQARSEPLGPGLHAATIELCGRGTYRVRTAGGIRARAKLAEGVSAGLADECRRTRRTVLVTEAAEGVVIVGAIQTQPSLEGKHDRLRIAAKELELGAERAIVLRVGKSLLVLDESGAIRVVGEGVSLRAAKAVRVLATSVELP
jgi:hypothetical protein